jgi:hypothetical protein
MRRLMLRWLVFFMADGTCEPQENEELVPISTAI